MHPINRELKPVYVEKKTFCSIGYSELRYNCVLPPEVTTKYRSKQPLKTARWSQLMGYLKISIWQINPQSESLVI